MSLTEMFLNEVCLYNEYQWKKQEKNSVLLIPSKDQQYYMPNIIIKDLEKLEKILNQYINTIYNSSLKFYKFDREHKIHTYLFYLIKSLPNEDCQDLVLYVKRMISYLEDNNFQDLYYSEPIGILDTYKVLARRCEEYYGSETPFTIRYYLEKTGFKFEMPLIRYGISGDNTAYIYSVQRKRLYNNKNCRIKSVNQMFNEANKGVKANRDITPSMLCSLTIFIGMLKNQGIDNIKVDGFLPRRYGYFNGVTSESEKDIILHNSVEKFYKLFIRLADQSEGIHIIAYPFDIDSYLHIQLDSEIFSKNPLLNNLYNIGKNYQKPEHQEYKKIKK